MAENNKDITYFAETDYRNKRTPFGIRTPDRSKHVYVIGKTGMGKSTMLENLAVQDIQNGNGMTFIDPHGGTAEKLLDYVPKERIKDVIYFAPHDIDYPVSFNVMEDVGKDQRHLVANGLMASFKKIWPDVWSARMEYISMNIILALLEYPDSTLLGINRMLSDKDYRKKVVDNVTDPSVKGFWVNEFAKYSDKIMVEAGASIQNKFGQFSSNPLIRNIIGQPTSSFNLREVMDDKKIFIANLSKGRMGEINTNLIGGMLITKIYLAAMSRANMNEEDLKKLPNFYVYVDEFQSFVNDSFADILSEARKYKLNLTIAHQYIEQMPETVRDAVFGNVGTTIAFRVGPFDAEVLEKVFAPKFTAEDIVNLGFAQIYLSLMIDGVGSQPFSAKTLPPVKMPEIKFRKEIIENSRTVFAKPRDVVEAEIAKWHEAVVVESKSSGEKFDKAGAAQALDSIKKDFGVKDFPPKKTYDTKPVFAPSYASAPARPPVTTSTVAPVRPPISAPATTVPVRPPTPAVARPVYPPPVSRMTPQPSPVPRTVPPPVAPKPAVPATQPQPAVKLPEKVSLSSLKRPQHDDKNATGENMGELKNILAKAMGARNKDFNLGKIEAKKDTSAPEATQKVIEEPVVAKHEPAKEPTMAHSPEIKKEEIKSVPAGSTVKEIPEDVLKKVLEEK